MILHGRKRRGAKTKEKQIKRINTNALRLFTSRVSFVSSAPSCEGL